MIGSVQLIITSFFLFLLVLCAYMYNIKQKLWDLNEIYEILFPHNLLGAKCPKPHEIVQWYSRNFGYDVEEHIVKTDDGFLLILERISKKNHLKKKIRGPPIVLQHGLFQSSGIYVVANKTESLAFYLVDQGYDVWLGNNRCVYDRHIELKSSDPAYWDWCLDELGQYDFSAIVKFVAKQTQQKIVYFGHSQGNAQAFVGLAINPELANHIQLFVAIAPAYYLNQFGHWSLNSLANLSDTSYSYLFGCKSFIPIMNLCQYYFHERIFSSFAYNMFSYLFGWTSDRWKQGRKPVIFRTTPRPISTKLIQHWLKISKHGKLVSYGPESKNYHLENIKCPVAVFWGKGDRLVDGKKLVESLYEAKVKVVFTRAIEKYEHMDLLWAEDTIEKVFEPLLELLKQTGVEPI
jgi:pimeloyl-ACP methyl ester carboxylesterase